MAGLSLLKQRKIKFDLSDRRQRDSGSNGDELGGQKRAP